GAAGLPPPASTFYRSGGSRTVNAGGRTGAVTSPGVPVSIGNDPAGANAAPLVRKPQPGPAAASGTDARARQAAAYPVLPPPAVNPAPATTPPSPTVTVPEGRNASQRAAGIPVPAPI